MSAEDLDAGLVALPLELHGRTPGEELRITLCCRVCGCDFAVHLHCGRETTYGKSSCPWCATQTTLSLVPVCLPEQS